MWHRSLAFFAVFALAALAAPLIARRAGWPASAAAAPAPQQSSATSTAVYFPERSDWQHKKPEEVGMDSAMVAEAVKAAIAHETNAPKAMEAARLRSYPREPFLEALGPLKDRGPATGLIIRHGYVVAEWGDPARVDMTFSVTKTFLTTLVGLAWQRGMIRDVHDYARDYMPPGVDLFDAPHNQKIKWDDLLRQSSDWSGTLWGKPDWADRPLIGVKPEDYPDRQMYEPGAHYKYNDVRVNVLAYAATEVWRRSLPEVLREEIMDPIGASSTWRWYGYDNSWIDLDGQKVQVMTGGGHWGGGMFINAYDMARFGYLFLRNGSWKGRGIVSTKWMDMARTPGPANAYYGFANWFLNNGKARVPAAPANAVCFVGDGRNIIYIDWDNDVVAVIRWIDSGLPQSATNEENPSLGPYLNEIVAKTLASIKK